MQDGTMSQEDMKEMQGDLYLTDFPSELLCFQCHSGIRRGELSTIVGPYGNGKSTFIRTMLSELLYAGKKVLLILSEEAVKMYIMPIWRTFFEMVKTEEGVNALVKNLFIFSLLDKEYEDMNTDSFLLKVQQETTINGIDVVVFDNFTTSFIGRAPIWVQDKSVLGLKALAVKNNIPVFSVFHTAKGTDIYKQIITGEEVRGSATSTNVGSYNYVVTTFFRCNPIRAFIAVDKARYHQRANKTFYELFYNSNLGIYTSTAKTSHNEILEIIREESRPKKTTRETK